VVAIVAGLGLVACGGGQEQNANEPSGIFPVQVKKATFPSFQRLAQNTHLVIAVRNTGRDTIPDIAVTITNPKYGTAVQAFATYLKMPGLASHSRPVWIVNRGPGRCGYSCQQGGAGAAVTAYSNTWALGPLKPGRTATFDWAVTAVVPGTYEVQYVVAAGLNGKAAARLNGGGIPRGTLDVKITPNPQKSYVNNNGQVVNTG
jgi:hypothetical protein